MTMKLLGLTEDYKNFFLYNIPSLFLHYLR